jgi:F0F1-type ATP synthase membrane subunit b/b'
MNRVRTQTTANISRIHAAAAAEIKAASKSARLELRRYAGEQALALAAQKISNKMSPRTDQRLVHKFIAGALRLTPKFPFNNRLKPAESRLIKRPRH